MDKKAMRQQMKKKLNGFTEDQYINKSSFLLKRVLEEPSIIEGETIALTISVMPEVDTRNLIEALWSIGKRVVVPKCTKETREMEFYEISSFSQTENVYLELVEPIPSICKRVEPSSIDVCIVPGIVFDHFGFRIGYGGGYYDRFLVDFSGVVLSLAFNEQVVEKIPNEIHDVPVHILITECERFVFYKAR